MQDPGLSWQGEVIAMDDEARGTIERFHEAFNRRDLGALG